MNPIQATITAEHSTVCDEQSLTIEVQSPNHPGSGIPLHISLVKSGEVKLTITSEQPKHEYSSEFPIEVHAEVCLTTHRLFQTSTEQHIAYLEMLQTALAKHVQRLRGAADDAWQTSEIVKMRKQVADKRIKSFLPDSLIISDTGWQEHLDRDILVREITCEHPLFFRRFVVQFAPGTSDIYNLTATG